jgi:hypothetical protein
MSTHTQQLTQQLFFKQVANKNLADVGTTTYDRSGKARAISRQ